MPRAKTSIKTLLDTCLENVTRNMDEWCSHYVETYGKDKKFYRFVVGPFDPLRKSLVTLSYQEVYFFTYFLFSSASKLLVQIISILREEKRLKKHYLELLITQQLGVLDLSREVDEIACHLRLAAIRCPVRSTCVSPCFKTSVDFNLLLCLRISKFWIWLVVKKFLNKYTRNFFLHLKCCK